MFLNSQKDSENRDNIENYILKNLNYKNMKFKGAFSAIIIISKSGKVENVKTFNTNNRKIDEEIKNIILSMPTWKPGKHLNNLRKI